VASELSITVAGAGKGGPSMAAHLMSLGFEVKLYELPAFAHKLKGFIRRGGIQCSGEVKGLFRPAAMTVDAKAAAADADVIMVAAMAMGHDAIVRSLLPHVKDGCLMAFHTGYYAGLRFYPRFSRLRRHVILAETDILPYLCLRTGPHSVRIDGIKKEAGVAAMPASDTRRAVDLLSKTKILRFFPRKHALEVSLSSMNLLFHAPIVLLNLPASENTKGNYVFYRDGVSPGVGRIIHPPRGTTPGTRSEAAPSISACAPISPTPGTSSPCRASASLPSFTRTWRTACRRSSPWAGC